MKSLTLILSLLLIAPAFGVDVTGGNSANYHNEGAAFQINGVTNKTYDSFHVYGNKNTGAAVLNSSNITLSNWTVENNGANGLGGVNSSNVTITNSVIRNNNRGIASPAWASANTQETIQVNGLWYLWVPNEGGNGKKFNCTNWTMRNVVYSGAGGVGEWPDSQCSNFTYDTCSFLDSVVPPNQQSWVNIGLAIENNPGPFIVTNCYWRGSRLAVQESQNVTVNGGCFDNCGIEFRSGSSHPIRLANVVINGASFVHGGYVGYSDKSTLQSAPKFTNCVADTQAVVDQINAISAGGCKLVATSAIKIPSATQPSTAPTLDLKSASLAIVNGQVVIGGITDSVTNGATDIARLNGMIYHKAHGNWYVMGNGIGDWSLVITPAQIASLELAITVVSPTTAPTTDQSAQLKADQLTIAQLQAQVTRLLNALNGITSQARAATQP